MTDDSVLTDTSERESRQFAEIVRWQARYRTMFAAMVGLAAITLKWAGVLSSNSLAHHWFGTDATLVGALALSVSYLALVRAHQWWVDRTGEAGLPGVLTVISLDVAVVFGVVVLVTPPEHYERALIICVFTVQITQMYFGWSAALHSVFGVSLAYALLVAVAAREGILREPQEALWTLLLFIAGAMTFLVLQGQRGSRIERLVRVFQRARSGDFSATYEEGNDRLPDHVTMIGRAWNDMRGYLEQIVLTDPLSGCFNRRGFEQMAAREISRAVRTMTPASMLALDLDHFKSVNDEYGHLTGDEVLREVGVVLRETARATGGDVVARFGGEEFVILAPDTDLTGAKMLAERLLAAFRNHYFESLRGQRQVTISIGIASDTVRSPDVVRTLLARADEALYSAKRSGRDQAVVWHPGMRAFESAAQARLSGSHQVLPL